VNSLAPSSGNTAESSTPGEPTTDKAMPLPGSDGKENGSAGKSTTSASPTSGMSGGMSTGNEAGAAFAPTAATPADNTGGSNLIGSNPSTSVPSVAAAAIPSTSGGSNSFQGLPTTVPPKSGESGSTEPPTTMEGKSEGQSWPTASIASKEKSSDSGAKRPRESGSTPPSQDPRNTLAGLKSGSAEGGGSSMMAAEGRPSAKKIKLDNGLAAPGVESSSALGSGDVIDAKVLQRNPNPGPHGNEPEIPVGAGAINLLSTGGGSKGVAATVVSDATAGGIVSRGRGGGGPSHSDQFRTSTSLAKGGDAGNKSAAQLPSGGPAAGSAAMAVDDDNDDKNHNDQYAAASQQSSASSGNATSVDGGLKNGSSGRKANNATRNNPETRNSVNVYNKGGGGAAAAPGEGPGGAGRWQQRAAAGPGGNVNRSGNAGPSSAAPGSGGGRGVGGRSSSSPYVEPSGHGRNLRSSSGGGGRQQQNNTAAANALYQRTREAGGRRALMSTEPVSTAAGPQTRSRVIRELDTDPPSGALLYAPGGSIPSLSVYLHRLLEIRIPATNLTRNSYEIAKRRLWGDGIYTSDSDIVAILLHTGKFPVRQASPKGIAGVSVVVRILNGEEHKFPSSMKHGLLSRSWGGSAKYAIKIVRSTAIPLTQAELLNLKPQSRRSSSRDSRDKQSKKSPKVLVMSAPDKSYSKYAAKYLQMNKHISEHVFCFSSDGEVAVRSILPEIRDRGISGQDWSVNRLQNSVLYIGTDKGEEYELRPEINSNNTTFQLAKVLNLDNELKEKPKPTKRKLRGKSGFVIQPTRRVPLLPSNLKVEKVSSYEQATGS